MWQTSDGVYFIPPAPEILELSKPEQNSLSKDNDLADIIKSAMELRFNTAAL